jgi:hypothetical protein
LSYLGAFRLPEGDFGSSGGFSFANSGFVFNRQHNSLFINSRDQMTAEVSIPPLVDSSNLAELNTARFLQSFQDPLEGRREAVNPSTSEGTVIGATLIHNSNFYIGVYSYYDAEGTQRKSQFVRPLDLSATGQVRGPIKVGDRYPSWVAGYATLIPPEWQSAFGGPALAGGCCFNIISLHSLGPSVSVFDPKDVGRIEPVPSTLLLGYPTEHPTLGRYESPTVNLNYNLSTQVTGVVFPSGSRSVLFFGTQGTGTPCYGEGVPGKPGPGQCYDPASADKGTHAYPYRYWVWAYDAEELKKVKNQRKNPWDVVPYGIWRLHLPFEPGKNTVQGASYDPRTQRIYLSASGADPGSGEFFGPIIHAFQVNP